MSWLRELAEQAGVKLCGWQLDMLEPLIENQHPIYVVLKKGNGYKEAKRLAIEFARCFSRKEDA